MGGSISMELKNIILTQINKPFTVISKKGEDCRTKNRNFYGLSFCIKGQITYSKDGKKYVSNQSNAVLLPKGQTYDLSRDKDGIFPVINFDCTGLDFSDILIFPLQNAEIFLKDFQKLSDLFLFENNRLRIYSLFYDMLHRIAQEQFPKNALLHHSLKYIEQNFSDPNLSNSMIAQSANISEVYLRKIFFEKHQQTPKQYVLDIRIEKAKQLLTNSPYSVSAISELCGFSSLYTFSRCFKDKVGIPPTKYAKQNRVYEI